MDLGGINWSFMNIVGPVLLIAVLVWAVLRNRSSRREIDRSERGTAQVYDEAEAVRRSGDEERR